MNVGRGDPAWLDAVKMSLVLGGLPGVVAAVLADTASEKWKLATGGTMLFFAAVFLAQVLAVVAVLVLRARRAKRGNGSE